MKYPRYPKYRSSGVEWIGEIPEGWGTLPFRRSLSRIEQGWSPIAEGREADEGDWGVLKLGAVSKGRFISTEHKALPSDVIPDARYEIRDGDFLLTRANTLDLVGDVCHVRAPRPKLMLSDIVYRIHIDAEALAPQFASYWLQSPLGRFQISRDARGASMSMAKVSQPLIKKWLVARPPIEEQHSVALFLDAKTAEIDALIAKKERLIELLEEKRSALITRAVTKGLDPSASTRDTGIAGLVPAHWKLSRLSLLTDEARPIMYGIVLPGPHVPGGVPIVKGGDVTPHRLKLDLLSRTTVEIESGYVRSRLKGGDLVFAIRGSIGAVQPVPDELLGSNLTQDAARVSIRKGVNADWLLFALRSQLCQSQVQARATGATIRGLNIRDLKRIVLPVPPRPEQDAIALHLTTTTRHLDELAGKVRLAIERLREYRTALISAAVTGKIDVRGFQPTPPCQ